MKNKISNELAIAVLEKKVEKLEKTITEFMDNWGPDVQKKRDERESFQKAFTRATLSGVGHSCG